MPETKIVETGKVELIVTVPNLSPKDAQIIARDVKRTLENCGKLNLLEEFVEIVKVERVEVLVEGAN